LIIKTKAGTIDEVLVPEEKWHELMLYSWIKNANYYQTKMNGKCVKLHRFLMNAKSDEIIDHINDFGNDVNNNTFENLRINTHSGNAHNVPKRKNATSQYFGVSFNTDTKKWKSFFHKNRIAYYCGLYDSELEAAIAYNIKAKEIYGDFANLNTISDEDFNKYSVEIAKKLSNYK
jgi:hypothetical protein